MQVIQLLIKTKLMIYGERLQYIRIFILIIVPVFFIFQACSIANVRKVSVSKTVQMNPGHSYEECVDLYPGQVLRSSFNSTDTVNFNIHYHIDESILYPISKQNIPSWEGSISPDDFDYYSKEQEFFCLMWDNLNSDSVKVTFNYDVRTK